MRPLVPSRSTLAVVALSGALLAGMSIRSSERNGGATPAPSPPLRPATSGFYAGPVPGSNPGGSVAGLPGTGAIPGLPGTGAIPGLPGTGPVAGLPGTAPPAAPALLPIQEWRLSSACREVRMGPEDVPPHHAFYFTRAIYNSGGRGLRGWGRRGRGTWSIDYPKADNQFMVMVDHLVNIDAYPCSNAVRLDDPQLRRFPFLYALEVGGMNLTQEEIHGLRDYLNAGGFLVIDDFWGESEWANFEYEIRQVLPGRPIVELPMDHPIFHSFYEIEEIIQVPNVGNGKSGGRTWENEGRIPYVLGIFDDNDRLMVVINFNTDLGDAWEWAEDPFYPLKYSRFAAEMGVNMIIYALSH